MRELKQNWLDVFRGFRLGLDVWKIALAFCGLLVSLLGIWALNELQEMDNGVPIAVAGLGVWVLLLVSTLRSEGKLGVKRILVLVGTLVVVAGLALIFRKLPEGTVICASRIVWLTLVWAFFGGAITRSAVVELATDERIGMKEALGFACARYRHYVWSILAPVVAIIFFLLVMAVGGWIARWPVANFLVALLTTPLYLLAGFIIMLLLVGLAVGWPLMFPAVSAEGSDSFDAISRAFSYVYPKPWKYIWYHLVAIGYAGAVIFFVVLFARGVVTSADSALSFSMGDSYKDAVRPAVQEWGDAIYTPAYKVSEYAQKLAKEQDFTGVGIVSGFAKVALHLPKLHPTRPVGVSPGWTETLTAFFAGIGFLAFILAVMSFVTSLTFSLHSIIYLLMRKDVDGTDMTEVFLEEEEEEDYLATVGLPEEGEEKAEEEKAEVEEEKAEEEEVEEAEKEEAPQEESKAGAEGEEKPKRRRTTRRGSSTRRRTTPKKEEKEES